MTDLEYRLIKEAIKKEVIQEMTTKQPKVESIVTETKRKQQAVFDKYFPDLRQADTGRYWRVKEAVIKLTNLCRFRSGNPSAWDSTIRSETEAESAVATYEAICCTAAELLTDPKDQ